MDLARCHVCAKGKEGGGGGAKRQATKREIEKERKRRSIKISTTRSYWAMFWDSGHPLCSSFTINLWKWNFSVIMNGETNTVAVNAVLDLWTNINVREHSYWCIKSLRARSFKKNNQKEKKAKQQRKSYQSTQLAEPVYNTNTWVGPNSYSDSERLFFFRENSLRGWLSISFVFVFCSGWLKEQLQVQAQGLSGHLSLFWPDINQSSWIGGNADGGLHERTPYWLNGFVPLAYQLQDEDLLKQASRSFSYLVLNLPY